MSIDPFSEGASLRPNLEAPTKVSAEDQAGCYGVHDTFRYGAPSTKGNLFPSHRLELSEKNFALNQEALEFQILRDTQGLHVPFKLQMERKIASRMQRLPPLRSSNLLLDVLTGNDTRLPIEEVLGSVSDARLPMDIHSAIDKKLNLD